MIALVIIIAVLFVLWAITGLLGMNDYETKWYNEEDDDENKDS